MTQFNQTVLMTGVDYFNDTQAINPFMDDSVKVDRDEAAREHQKIKQAFETAGIKVVQIPPPKSCQDGVYTANWALVRGNKAVLARLPNARQAEETYAKENLEKLDKTVIEVPEGLKFSGQGDALPCGNLLFCGQGYRSDAKAQEIAAQALGYERLQLQTIPQLDTNGRSVINPFSGWPDSYYYDIDLALSVLRQDLIAWCPAAFTSSSQEKIRALTGIDKIEVAEHEAKHAFACNLVSTGQTVIMNAGAPELAAKIEEKGIKTIQLFNDELAKGGGSIRCTSLTLYN